MGILTDAFIANESEVMSADFASSIPSYLFPTVEAKGITQLELASLDAVLLGEDMDVWHANVDRAVRHSEHVATLMRDIGRERGMGDASEGPWIYRLSDGFLARLADLAPSSVAAVGTDWAVGEWQERAAIFANHQQRREHGPLARALDTVLERLFPMSDTGEGEQAVFVSGMVEYLERLRKLAAEARSRDSNLYLWISL